MIFVLASVHVIVMNNEEIAELCKREGKKIENGYIDTLAHLKKTREQLQKTQKSLAELEDVLSIMSQKKFLRDNSITTHL